MRKLSKAKSIEKLTSLIKLIDEIEKQKPYSSIFNKWRRDTEVALINIFGESSRHVKEFRNISYMSRLITADSSGDDKAFFRSGLKDARVVLQSMIDEINEYWETGEDHDKDNKKMNYGNGKKVFIIHGHDNGMKEEVARFIEKIELTPIILHEQSNSGKTIIEKFEHHPDVSYAIALLSPDDMGCLMSEQDSARPRARQNVIFEFGYFIGKMGRDRVCGLVKNTSDTQIEIPSDYSGVLYIDFDANGSWRLALVKELKAIGIEVDANKAI